MNELPFNLRSDEKIEFEIKPVEKLKNFFKMQIFITGSFPALVTLFGIPLIPFIYFLAVWLAKKKYEQSMYWITNKRIVYKRGIFGYKITSIPYGRVSDVIISRTWFENLFGIASLNVQTLAGQVSRNTGGSEGNLAGVPNPEELQEKILQNMETATASRI